ncbi:DUF4249 family protein [Candidatus Palauibacter sp.]|uniref:DUF4249 family protein n=1 Tax=Candidatus Palauibacter sp. TaxID=3101350 RepID=UPI003B5A2D81
MFDDPGTLKTAGATLALAILWLVEGVLPMFEGRSARARHGARNLALGVGNAAVTALIFAAATLVNRLPPPATGATVIVVDGAGLAFPFPEVEPGLYEAENFFADVGETYTLILEYQGDTYEASALLHEVAPIDSLYFEFEEESLIIEEAGFRAAIDFVDPVGQENYYLWEQLVDGVNEIPPDPQNNLNLVSKDEFYDGRDVTGFQPSDEVAIQPGQHTEIRQIALSRLAYDYYYALFEQNALGTGNPLLHPARERARKHHESGPPVQVRVRPLRGGRGERRGGDRPRAVAAATRAAPGAPGRARIRPAALCSLPCSTIPLR